MVSRLTIKSIMMTFFTNFRAQRLLDNIGDGLLTKFNTNLISIPDEDVKGLEGRRDSINHREMDPIIRPKGHNAQILSVHTEAYDN